jgi:cytochrome c6
MNVSKNRKAVVMIFTAVGWMLLQLPARADDAAAKLYQGKCIACHGADGSGNTTAGKMLMVKDLRDPEVQKQTDAELTAIVTKGKDKMPAYEKSLKPDEIKSLIGYVRELAAKK